MEVKTARDLRVALAEHDVPPSQFAREAGISRQYLSHLLHDRAPLAPVRGLIEPTLARIVAGEIVPDRGNHAGWHSPRRKTRAEQLREERLASGCTATIRYP